MLYECVNVIDVWNIMSACINVHITWKHIVIGYYQDLNDISSDINLICTIIAYSIFKENNKCKWNETVYRKCNVLKTIVKDLKYLKHIQMYMTKKIFKTINIDHIINCITNN